MIKVGISYLCLAVLLSHTHAIKVLQLSQDFLIVKVQRPFLRVIYLAVKHSTLYAFVL